MGHRDVTHVETNRTISEDWQFKFSPQQPFFNRFGRLIPRSDFLHALYRARDSVDSETNPSVFQNRIQANGLDFSSPPSIVVFRSTHSGSPSAIFTNALFTSLIQKPVVAHDKRRFFTALGTHTPAHLDADGLFFSSDGHQSLIPTGQIDWEKGVSHWIHDSGCCFLRPTHTATNSNRGRVLPAQIRYFPNLHKNAIDGVIVFVDLSSKVLLRVFRSGVGHLLCRFSADLVGLGDP